MDAKVTISADEYRRLLDMERKTLFERALQNLKGIARRETCSSCKHWGVFSSSDGDHGNAFGACSLQRVNAARTSHYGLVETREDYVCLAHEPLASKLEATERPND